MGNETARPKQQAAEAMGKVLTGKQQELADLREKLQGARERLKEAVIRRDAAITREARSAAEDDEFQARADALALVPKVDSLDIEIAAIGRKIVIAAADATAEDYFIRRDEGMAVLRKLTGAIVATEVAIEEHTKVMEAARKYLPVPTVLANGVPLAAAFGLATEWDHRLVAAKENLLWAMRGIASRFPDLVHAEHPARKAADAERRHYADAAAMTRDVQRQQTEAAQAAEKARQQ